MATKLDNDLAKHISNFGYNAVDTLYINSNGFTASIDGTLTANRTLTIPDNSGTIALLSDIAGGGFLPLTGGTLSGPLTFSDAGNVNNPAIRFVDAKLGIYRHGSNHLRIGVNGTAVQGWQQTYIENLQQVRNIDGTESTPAISFANNLDMGLWRVSASELGISTGGVKRLSITDTGISANIIPIIADNYKSNNLGTAGNTLYGATNNTQGMYFGLNRINFSTNSVERLGITDTQILPSIAMRNIDGTTGSPAYSFSSATGNGMWMNTGNRLAFSILGTTMVHIISTGLDVLGNITLNAGTSAAPSLACRGTGLTTTGLFWTATPTLGVAVSGAQAVGFETGGLKLYGSTAGNNSTYLPSLLGYYQEVNYTSTFTPTAGTLTLNPNINFQLTRIGNTVKLTFQGMTSTVKCNTTCYFDSTQIFPTQFQQKSGQSTYFYINATVAGSITQIILQVDTRFRLVTTTGTDFPANTEIKVSGFSVSWSILV